MATEDKDEGRFAPIDAIEGELVETTERGLASANALAPAEMDQSLVAILTKAELDQQITTARAYPRSAKRVLDASIELATLTKDSSIECGYSVPRGRDDNGKAKAITGPSVRLAEIVAGRWGNCRAESRVVQVDRTEGYVEAEGIFHDLETNYAVRARVRRSIRGKPYQGKPGRIFTDDMINVTGNAAAAIAFRNAVFKGVPKAVWGEVYVATQAVVRGDLKTLAANRDEMLAAFRDKLQIAPEKVFAALGVPGLEDIGLDELVIARGYFSAIRNNEITVEDLIKAAEPANPVAAAAAKSLADGGGKKADGPKPQQQQKPALGKDAGKAAATTDTAPKLARKDQPHDPKTGEVNETDAEATARLQQTQSGGAGVQEPDEDDEAALPDPEVIPGPAPKDVTHTLAEDGWTEFGKPSYLNGERKGSAGKKAGLPEYEALYAAPEAQASVDQTQPSTDAADMTTFDDYRDELGEQTTVADVEAAFKALKASDDWPQDDETQALFRGVTYDRVLEIDPEGDPSFDPFLFDLWLDRAEAPKITPVHQTLIRTPSFRQLPEAERDALSRRVKIAKERT